GSVTEEALHVIRICTIRHFGTPVFLKTWSVVEPVVDLRNGFVGNCSRERCAPRTVGLRIVEIGTYAIAVLELGQVCDLLNLILRREGYLEAFAGSAGLTGFRRNNDYTIGGT